MKLLFPCNKILRIDYPMYNSQNQLFCVWIYACFNKIDYLIISFGQTDKLRSDSFMVFFIFKHKILLYELILFN